MQAAPFQELVFWGDTCATRTPLTRLFPCELPGSFSMNSPLVRVFGAYAAPVGLVAVENEMPDGQWHGAFTYALLEGLKGSAATPVTGETLRDYLLNAMRAFMSERDQKRPTVAKEPSFGITDRMEFGTPAFRTFPVTLRFPAAAVGHPVRVAVSAPRRPWPRPCSAPGTGQSTSPPGRTRCSLTAPARRRRSRWSEVEWMTVSMSAEPASGVRITVRTGSPLAEVFMIDHRFALVHRSIGDLEAVVTPGVYKVKAKLADAQAERLVLCEADQVINLADELRMRSPAPLARTRASRTRRARAWLAP